MLTTIRRLHRILVDRLAETSWLRDRAGARARWAHYEHHARAWRRAAERHDRARARAAAVRARHQRPPRVAAGYQAAIARIVGDRTGRSGR
jgi:hypothetical protein